LNKLTFESKQTEEDSADSSGKERYDRGDQCSPTCKRRGGCTNVYSTDSKAVVE